MSARCALVTLVLAALSCGPRPLPINDWPDPELKSEVELYPIEVIPPQAAPDQEGFTYCCGNAEYKMAISCDDGIKRCYESSDSGWTQTYGRHCKKWLGETCYLQTCERVCDGKLY